MFLSFEEYFPVSGLSETMALRNFSKASYSKRISATS